METQEDLSAQNTVNPVEGIIPSTFSIHAKEEVSYSLVSLSKNIEWLTNVKIPVKLDFGSLVSELMLKHAKNYFIAGCNYNNFRFLKKRGYEGIRIGCEAILNLKGDHFKKRSLRELVRRGMKRGSTVEIKHSREAARKLQEFGKFTRHGSEPQLKYLFNTAFEENNRLFVFRNPEGEWLGALLISEKSDKWVQSEAILCRNKAQPGIMEALIHEISRILRDERYEYWSLGAVPFIIYNSRFLSKEQIINVSGRLMKFAYNYKGLYHFKNKFNPIWVDYYFVIRPSFNPAALLEILIKSNLLKLAIYKLVHPGRFS
jgi:lysylphosphatidylglycerol synthetase-like protein (DUF2156 family)